jgi:7-cyano-7-deazaguanine synthase in queuosine biosynthesis
MSTDFLCGLDLQELGNFPTQGGSARYVLQVGQRQGNIAIATHLSRADRVPLSPLAQDLVEIGAYLHQSDRLVERDLERWSRTFDYYVAVSDVDRWQDLVPLLGRIASFVSGDRIRFHIYPRRHRSTWSAEIQKPEGQADSVTLYSGGLDSSSGLSTLLAAGQRTVAVTQYSNRLEDRTSLLRDLSQASGGEVPLVAFRVVPRRTRTEAVDGGPPPAPLKDVENTWRLRTFLYLALAGAVADTLGIDRILMFENGILAHNLPFDPYVIGARSTRHAHPTFLLLMERLFEGLFQRQITIRNPFQFLTKGCEAGPLAELTKSLPGRPSLVARTNSCWYFPNLVARLAHSGGRSITHCGACMPCKIRRLAVLEAGLERWEPVEGQYYVNPLAASTFTQGPPLAKFAHDQHSRNLRRLQAYTERINRCEDLQAFAAEWPQIFEFEGKNLSTQPTASVTNRIFNMYRVFAHHAASVV